MNQRRRIEKKKAKIHDLATARSKGESSASCVTDQLVTM